MMNMFSGPTLSTAAQEWMKQNVTNEAEEHKRMLQQLEKKRKDQIKRSDADAMKPRDERVKLSTKPYENMGNPLIKWMPIYSFGLDHVKKMVIILRILGKDNEGTYYMTSDVNKINNKQFIQYDDVKHLFYVETEASRYILDSNSEELDPEIAIEFIKDSGYRTNIDLRTEVADLENYLFIPVPPPPKPPPPDDEPPKPAPPLNLDNVKKLMQKFFLAGLYQKPTYEFVTQFKNLGLLGEHNYLSLYIHDTDLKLDVPNNEIFISKIKLYYHNILFEVPNQTTMIGGSRTKMKRTKSKNRKRSKRKRSKKKRSIKKRSKKKRH